MLDKPRHDMIQASSSSHLLAGEKFSADQQCELVFGAGTPVCPYMVGINMPDSENGQNITIYDVSAYQNPNF